MVIEFLKGFIHEYGVYALIIVIFVISVLLIAIKAIIVWLSDSYVIDKRRYYYDNNIEIASKCNKLGNRLLADYATYNEYVNDIGLNSTFSCSSSIVANANNNPVNYVIKYSEISYEEFYLDRIDYCIDFLRDLEELNSNFDILDEAVQKELPVLVRSFATKHEIPYVVSDVDLSIKNYKEPYFEFLYISPVRRSRQECNIDITLEVLEKIREVLYEKMSKAGHIKIQRSAMSNDLREAIKLRDHYTCCICGNSVYNEPNLLLEVDHIIPVSKGGKTEASNLQTLCWRCNRSKGNNI